MLPLPHPLHPVLPLLLQTVECDALCVYGLAPSYISDIFIPVTDLLGRSHLCSHQKSYYDIARIATSLDHHLFAV